MNELFTENREVKTIGQYFNRRAIISFVLGFGLGILFAVPLVERGVFGTDFIANVIDAKIERKFEEKGAVGQPERESGYKISSGPLVPIGQNSFVVEDQAAGFSVIASLLTLSQGGWVAIHEEMEDGGLGNILGARRFPEGTYVGSSIELLRETIPGRAYFAVLHGDDGDSVFDFEKEVPVRDTSGALIATRFLTAFSE